MGVRAAALAAALLFLLPGCASRGPLLAPGEVDTGIPPALELSDVPFHAQTDYYCGPASLATVLNAAGRDVEPAELVSQVYLPGKRGSLQIEMTAAARRYGLMPYRIDPTVDALLAELNAGRPVLVFQNLGIRLLPVWHYAVLIGYDLQRGVVLLRSGTEARRTMPAAKFLDTWRRAGHWALVMLRPGEIPANPDLHRYLSAAAAMAPLNHPESDLSMTRAAVRQWPDQALAHFALGNSLYALGRMQDAGDAFRRATRLNPLLLPARNNLAHILADRGCPGQALREVEQALRQAGTEQREIRRTLLQTRSEIEARLAAAGNAAASSCPP